MDERQRGQLERGAGKVSYTVDLLTAAIDLLSGDNVNIDALITLLQVTRELCREAERDFDLVELKQS